MAALMRRSLSNVKIGFVQGDEDACSAVIADDEEVDLLVKQVDKAGTNVLIRFQPLASDFRNVLATVKLGSHLENISVVARSLEQIIYLLESITEEVIYVAEAKDIRRGKNKLAVENER